MLPYTAEAMMNNWTLFALKGIDGNGGPILTDLSTEQKLRVKSYLRALATAATSNVPQPIFSDYYVRAAVGPVGGKFIRCGNIEYGDRQSLHAEECAVAAYASRTNSREQPQRPILALVSGQPGETADPCGNCRDILLQAFGPTLEIVSGAPEGGKAIVSTLGMYLSEQFAPVKKVFDPVTQLVKTLSAVQSENDPYSTVESLFTTPHYRAALTTKFLPAGFPNGLRARTGSVGAIDLGCDYHPLYPIRDAIRGIERRELRGLRLRYVVVSSHGPDDPPHVFYLDRQHLLEFQLRLEAAGGYESNPAVLLFKTTEDGMIIQGWKTTVKKWYPLPFSPKNFGPEFMSRYTAYYQKKNESR
jgi:cytidine deaminase